MAWGLGLRLYSSLFDIGWTSGTRFGDVGIVGLDLVLMGPGNKEEQRDPRHTQHTY